MATVGFRIIELYLADIPDVHVTNRPREFQQLGHAAVLWRSKRILRSFCRACQPRSTGGAGLRTHGAARAMRGSELVDHAYGRQGFADIPGLIIIGQGERGSSFILGADAQLPVYVVLHSDTDQRRP